MLRLAAILLVFCVSAVYSLCENATGCKCSRKTPYWQVHVTCTGLDPQLQYLPLQNVTRFSLKEANFTNILSLEIMREFDNLERVTFRNSELPRLDWNWLPDNCTRVILTYSSFKRLKIFTHPPFNEPCDLRPSLNITKLYIYTTPYIQVPRCLPHSLKTLVFNNVPLTTFRFSNGSVGSRNITWPPNLTFLAISRSKIHRFNPDIFDDVPRSLQKMDISTCETPLYRFPSIWPKTGVLTTLSMKNCHVNETRPSDFLYLQNLTYLNLRGNDLSAIPEGIPRTLKSLILSVNSIRSISDDTWEGMNRLRVLTLETNQLQTIPRNMPASLHRLNLHQNMIEFADRNAFNYLKNLTELNLMNNRLLNMPEGLPNSMRYLNLQYNQIALVRSTENYEFCSNCSSFNLDNNPWICNEDMIRLLLWASLNPVTLVLHERCGDPIPDTDLGRVGIDLLTKYLDFMSKSIEFKKCAYSIKALECINASLATFPPKPPNTLEIVEITFNPDLTEVPDSLFLSQSVLTKLYLNSNSIRQFPVGLPESIVYLDLNYNEIQGLPTNIGHSLSKLKFLKEILLVGNRIKVVYDYQLAVFPSLEWVALDGNPVVCDCSLYSLVYWYESLGRAAFDFNFPTCKEPEVYKNRRITQLFGAFIYTLQCIPVQCDWPTISGSLNCSGPIQVQNHNVSIIPFTYDPSTQPTIPPNSYWLTLDLSFLQLEEDDIHLKQLIRLQVLDLTENIVSVIPAENLPKTITDLILVGNRITDISPSLTKHLPRLHLLDLRRNNIKTISSDGLVTLPAIGRVYLHDNPIKCDCELRQLVTYIQAEQGNNLTTQRNKFETLECAEPPNMKGLSLLELQESEYCKAVIWTEITGGVVGSVCFLLLVSIGATMIVYKRKKLQERKDIILGFQKLLEKEALLSDKDTDSMIGIDGNAFQYDAFVSYCSNGADDEFVYYMIQELEEKRGKKFCIHERDFTPGQAIADNIVKSISLSKRVIIVVSRKYAASAWCQYEVQVALAQLHEHRRGRLLIPVLLEDVTQDENYAGSVKTILSLITGLHVPQGVAHQEEDIWNKFWDKLEAALPQKQLAKTATYVSYEVD